MGTCSTTKPQPQIFVCGPIYFIMASVPADELPSINISIREPNVAVRAFSVGRQYFVLEIEVDPFTPNRERARLVQAELQFVWKLLFSSGHVDTEAMPEPKAGNPAMMALDPSDLSPIQREVVRGQVEKVTAARIVGRRMVRPT